MRNKFTIKTRHHPTQGSAPRCCTSPQYACRNNFTINQKPTMPSPDTK